MQCILHRHTHTHTHTMYTYTYTYTYIYYIHVHATYTFTYMYLLDISRQLACMKLGRREKYQPIQYCWAGCLGYPVHTCHLPIDIQQIYCSAQTGQHLCLRHFMLSCLGTATYMCTYYIHIHIQCYMLQDPNWDAYAAHASQLGSCNKCVSCCGAY